MRYFHVYLRKVVEVLTHSQIEKNLDSSKLFEFADDNFKFDENGGKLSRRVENTGKRRKVLITSSFSFSYSVFKRLVLQTRKNKGLFEKGLNTWNQVYSSSMQFFLAYFLFSLMENAPLTLHTIDTHFDASTLDSF